MMPWMKSCTESIALMLKKQVLLTMERKVKQKSLSRRCLKCWQGLPNCDDNIINQISYNLRSSSLVHLMSWQIWNVQISMNYFLLLLRNFVFKFYIKKIHKLRLQTSTWHIVFWIHYYSDQSFLIGSKSLISNLMTAFGSSFHAFPLKISIITCLYHKAFAINI